MAAHRKIRPLPAPAIWRSSMPDRSPAMASRLRCCAMPSSAPCKRSEVGHEHPYRFALRGGAEGDGQRRLRGRGSGAGHAARRVGGGAHSLRRGAVHRCNTRSRLGRLRRDRLLPGGGSAAAVFRNRLDPRARRSLCTPARSAGRRRHVARGESGGAGRRGSRRRRVRR